MKLLYKHPVGVLLAAFASVLTACGAATPGNAPVGGNAGYVVSVKQINATCVITWRWASEDETLSPLPADNPLCRHAGHSTVFQQDKEGVYWLLYDVDGVMVSTPTRVGTHSCRVTARDRYTGEVTHDISRGTLCNAKQGESVVFSRWVHQ